jgi:hypothetical protein
MHAVWSRLLDDDFLHACQHGIVICLPDGITRRVYPRIFTYSADYPEKYVTNLIYTPLPGLIYIQSASFYGSLPGEMFLPSLYYDEGQDTRPWYAARYEPART